MNNGRQMVRTPALGFLLLALACAQEPGAGASREAAAPASLSEELPPEQLAFWNRLSSHCGKAYAGRIDDTTPYYETRLAGPGIVVHFRECSDDRIHIPLHIRADRSRNWILTKTGGTIRLKHDHRHEDGTEDTITQYGGDAPVPGLPTRQIFRADAHTATILPDRSDNFWFMDFVDEQTFMYGVHWPKFGHSLRISFDLTKPVDPPPAPWGY